MANGEGGGVTPLIVNNTDPTKARIATLGMALNEFVRLNPHMPVAQVQAFLLIALDHEMSVMEYQAIAGVKKSTASKHLMDLGQSRLDGDGAYGLIERGIDAKDPRKARFTLSRKGQALLKKLLASLDGGAR